MEPSAVNPPSQPVETIFVRENLTLDPGRTYRVRLVVQASHVVIDGQGAELVGPATPGQRETYEKAGVAIEAKGCNNVVLRNVKAHGFATGLVLTDCAGWSVEGCDFSDNYSNPDFGWGELPSRGGILLSGVKWSVFRNNVAKNVWDGIHLRDSDDNLVIGNKFHYCTNVCAKLWNASRNAFIENDLSYGIRIDREAGEVHARDSSSVLIESGSNHNLWYRNDVRGGGDGFFIRPLNGWLSTHNLFIENDASQGNNNCFEAWSPDNVYIRNLANEGSYGFWLGGSDRTVLMGNEASRNGRPEGYHNAPEPIFSHGGIVIVGATASGVTVEGNVLKDNNGGGVVARGDVKKESPRFVFENWVVQDNVCEGNRWPVHATLGRGLFLAGNQGANEGEAAVLDVEDVQEATGAGRAPIAKMRIPERVDVGKSVRFTAEESVDLEGGQLEFTWWVGAEKLTGAAPEWCAETPGRYDVQLQVSNGLRAGAAWGTILVADGTAKEIGTEANASGWVCEVPEGARPIQFWDASDAVEGRYSLGLTAFPSDKGLCWSVFPCASDASGKDRLTFWLRYRNENVFLWQNEAVTVRVVAEGGEVVWRGVPDVLPGHLAQGNNRENWIRLELPLDLDDPLWRREVVGAPDLARVQSVAMAFDSSGEDRYHVWIDGLTFSGG